jgi:hypothetical protein
MQPQFIKDQYGRILDQYGNIYDQTGNIIGNVNNQPMNTGQPMNMGMNQPTGMGYGNPNPMSMANTYCDPTTGQPMPVGQPRGMGAGTNQRNTYPQPQSHSDTTSFVSSKYRRNVNRPQINQEQGMQSGSVSVNNGYVPIDVYKMNDVFVPMEVDSVEVECVNLGIMKQLFLIRKKQLLKPTISLCKHKEWYTQTLYGYLTEYVNDFLTLHTSEIGQHIKIDNFKSDKDELYDFLSKIENFNPLLEAFKSRIEEIKRTHKVLDKDKELTLLELEQTSFILTIVDKDLINELSQVTGEIEFPENSLLFRQLSMIDTSTVNRVYIIDLLHENKYEVTKNKVRRV